MNAVFLRIFTFALAVGLLLWWSRSSSPVRAEQARPAFPVQKTDAQWRQQLTAEQYAILRGKGTERSCTGKLLNNHQQGEYACVGCGQVLFDSDTKFESGTGWPSFYQPFRSGSVVEETDTSWGMTRTEVLCANCGGHLGHVFADGPAPTHRRYCINSVCLKFLPRK